MNWEPGFDEADGAVRREATVEVDGRRFAVGVWVPDGGGTARPRRSSTAGQAGRSGSAEVVAPMQGTIVKILVEVGDSIKAGDAVFLLEAMKMENSLAAERSGSVAEIRVSKGDSVGAGDVLAVIE